MAVNNSIPAAPQSGRISLHNLETGKKLCQHARIADRRPRSPLAWRFRFLPDLKDGVSTEET